MTSCGIEFDKALAYRKNGPDPDHCHIGKLVQQLVKPKGPPKSCIRWTMSFFLGIPCFAIINVEMNHPFRKAQQNIQSDGQPHQRKYSQRKYGVEASMLHAPPMQIDAAARQHSRRLQEIIGKHVFHL